MHYFTRCLLSVHMDLNIPLPTLAFTLQSRTCNKPSGVHDFLGLLARLVLVREQVLHLILQFVNDFYVKLLHYADLRLKVLDLAVGRVQLILQVIDSASELIYLLIVSTD